MQDIFSKVSPKCEVNKFLCKSNLAANNAKPNFFLKLNNIKEFESNKNVIPIQSDLNSFSYQLEGKENSLLLQEDSKSLNVINAELTNNLNNTKKHHQIPRNSRVLLISCSDPNLLEQFIYSNFNLTDLTFQKIQINSNKNVLVIGWYDLRHIPWYLNLFKKINFLDLSLNYITDDFTYNYIFNNNKFNLFDDLFDTIYLYIPNNNIYFDNINFQNSVINELSKFGAVYKIDLLERSFICYKCRFYNIRTPFVVKQANRIKINGSDVIIFNTLIELQYHINKKLPKESVDLTCLKNPSSEWRKYHILKHRRLGSIPFSNYNILNENKIDLCKIVSGHDQRVTLMIKNIPNKVTHTELKNVIDVISFGEYQFLYLRIDFENHCNVGYAFISFKTHFSIVPFYNYLQGKKWKIFNSEKVCQLAYARVQGLESLINKFKDSKIMTNNPEYRPRIYHTDGPLKGLEIPFPTKRN